MATAPGSAYVLKSGIYAGPGRNDKQLAFAIALAAAFDGSVWLASQMGLYSYSASQGVFTQILATGYIVDPEQPYSPVLAPVDYQNVYFLTTTPGIGTNISYYQESATAITTLPALPVGDTPTAISAGPDGTLWAVGAQGVLYTYAATGWVPQPAPPGILSVLSVGSASFVLALVSDGGVPAIYSWSGSAWVAFSGPSAAGATWLAACSDNSYWIATAAGLTLAVGGTSTTQSFSLATELGPVLFTAGSRYACMFLALDEQNPAGAIGVSMACLGVMDQPPQAWPVMTAGQQAAYTSITNSFFISDPAGFRSLYSNLNVALAEISIQLHGLTCPAGIAPADFTAVQTQLSAEITYADSIRNLFTNLNTLNTEIGLQQTDTYAQVVAMVELPDQPAQQPSTLVQVVLGSLMEKLFSAALSQVSPPVQTIVSLSRSVYSFVADQQAKAHGGQDRNTVLQIACSNLAGLLATINANALTAASGFQTSILHDWGRMQACGLAINTGVWNWPPTFNASVIDGCGAAMQLDFYQTLMPAKWQIMQIWTLFISGVNTPSTPPYAPAYSQLYKTQVDGQGDEMYWFWICADQTAAVNVNTGGPFPNLSLLTTVFGLSDLQGFFTGENGWALPVSQSSDWQAAPAGQPFVPWSNSTSPLG